jgi:hypothetical protein
MTDKELLELAAKAAGYLETASIQNGYGFIALAVMDEDGDWTGKDWNPLTDDGDALRLAVKLKLQISFGNRHVSVFDEAGFINFQTEVLAHRGDDAATRRAITRAAAEIGKAML